MIELSDIEKSYPLAAQRHYVLRKISLSIAEGDFLSIMGPSGSGKTSLLSVLGLMDSDWSGSYRFAGTDLQTLKERARKDFAREHIGFVFQHYHLLDDLTVAENLELPLSYRNVRGSERQARVAELLDRFGMAARRDLYPRQLSGGQQQIVAVARAVIARPRLLLCDEPTGALHSSQGEQVMDLLGELNQEGTTIVQVTHNPEYAARGGRQVELFDGWMKQVA